MGRRDKDDPKWKKLKEDVFLRDGFCRLLRVLSVQEALILRKKAGSLLGILDPAHVFPVSTHPEICYTKENVVVLNRYSHDCLDTCKHPITGENISFEERQGWWERIVGKNVYQFLTLLIKGEED